MQAASRKVSVVGRVQLMVKIISLPRSGGVYFLRGLYLSTFLFVQFLGEEFSGEFLDLWGVTQGTVVLWVAFTAVCHDGNSFFL